MDLFNFVKNDSSIIQRYNQISEFEDEDKGWAHHNYQHVCNVATLVEKFLNNLGYDSEFIEEAKVAAILHDTGCLEGKDGHALRGYEFAKEYFKKNHLKLKNEDLVLEAIKIHSDGFDTDNIIALTLILSDKLDIKYTRVAKEGYNVVGMRQLQFIKDIEVKIENNILDVNFICDNNINIKELEEFYFTDKVFKAIRAFSNKMSFVPEVLINNSKWELFYCIEKDLAPIPFCAKL